MKKRLVWADLVRILAIYLVLFVHSAIFPKGPFLSVFTATILYAIAITCVPLFFMLSGALLLSKKEPTIIFFKKRFFRIFIPYVFWSIIFIVYLFFYQWPHNLTDIIKIISTGFRGFWFLPILYILYILTPSLRIYVEHVEKKQIILPLLILFLLVCFLPYIRNTAVFPLQSRDDILSQVVDYSGYFLLGYFVTVSELFKNKRRIFILLGVGLLWSIIGTLYLHSKLHTYNGFYYSYISPSTVFITVGIFALFLNLERKFSTWSSKIKNFIAQLSNLIFGVYLLQTVVVQVMGRINFVIPHTSLPVVIDLPFIAFVFLICNLIIIVPLSKIPSVRKIIS